MILAKFSTFKWWQVALIAVIVSAIGGLSSLQSPGENTRLYTDSLIQAPWAPPGWLFAPAWALNNFFLLLALQRIIKSNTPERKTLLVLQAAIWIIFFSFNYIYFNRKSTVLAAGWTITDALLAVTSFVLAFKSDKKTAWLYMPLIIWTLFASTLAGYQALYNADDFLNTKPLIK